MKAAPGIDLGLEVLASVVKPGERVPTRTIAAVCECTNTAIFLIEQKAMKKVRERMRKAMEQTHAEFYGSGSEVPR